MTSSSPARDRVSGCLAVLALWAASTLAVAALAAAAPAPGGLGRLMALLSQRRHGEATFVERDYLAVLSRPLASSGVLIYDAPDHLVKRTLHPRRESLDLDHGVVTVRRGGRSLRFDLSSYPEAAIYVEAIRATLAGDRAALTRVFRVGFQGNLAHWSLELTPTEARIARHLRSIRMQGARADIREVVIVQRDGDRSVMTLGPPPPRAP